MKNLGIPMMIGGLVLFASTMFLLDDHVKSTLISLPLFFLGLLVFVWFERFENNECEKYFQSKEGIASQYEKHLENCKECWQEDGIMPCEDALYILKRYEQN